jgi:outer membrane protein OmpA-like peptidoglycan-associated protein
VITNHGRISTVAGEKKVVVNQVVPVKQVVSLTIPPQVTNDPISIGNVNFDFCSSKLTAEAKAILKNIAKVVKDHGFTYIYLSGHTDVFAQAGFDNQKLSEQRNAAVRAFLKSLIPAGVTIKLDAKAATEPIIAKTDASSRAINRRVEIIVK